MITIAALYVDPRGPYASMAGVDAWTEARDARTYAGPHAVVAHPPCKTWSRLSHLAELPTDGGAFRRALMAVREYGGVLEHPAHSKAWDRYELPPPGDRSTDALGGYTVEVEQVEWGHVARKRTWLYLARVPRSALEAPPFRGRAPTHWASGSRTPSSRTGKPVPPGIKVCSATQRNRTPPAFAEYLVRLARAAR